MLDFDGKLRIYAQSSIGDIQTIHYTPSCENVSKLGFLC